MRYGARVLLALMALALLGTIVPGCAQKKEIEPAQKTIKAQKKDK